MSHSSEVQLDYGIDPSHRRQSWRRPTLIAIVLLSGATILWVVGPASFTRARNAYYWRRCMNYTAPADRIIYDEVPALLDMMTADPAYTRSLHSVGYRDFVYFVDPLRRTWGLSGWNTPTIFMHSRQLPGKDPRLVLLTASGGGVHATKASSSPDWQVRINLIARVQTRSGKVTTSQNYPPALRPWYDPNLLPANDPLYVRLYAGQLDPNDSSHFTVAYRIGNFGGTLDGYLKSDDHVELKARGVPQTLEAWQATQKAQTEAPRTSGTPATRSRRD